MSQLELQFTVLAEIKKDIDLKSIPVIMLTSSHAQADILKAYDNHVNCYITKPLDFTEFTHVAREIESFWLTLAKLPPFLPEKKEKMKKILIIDDDPDICTILEAGLSANGYEALKASEGVEALVKAKDHKPDLIILDMDMPVMDGYQFLKEIRWQMEFREIPVIILTAKTYTEDILKELGIVNFFTKPFDFKELLIKIKECLENQTHN